MRDYYRTLKNIFAVALGLRRIFSWIEGHIIVGEYSPVRLFLMYIFARYIEVPLLHVSFLACRGPLRFLLNNRVTRLIVAYGLAYPIGHWGDTGRPLPLSEVERLMEELEGRIAVGPCRCRIGHRACDHPIETDIVFRTGTDVFLDAFPYEYRVIEKEEALEIVRECSRQGMFHMVFRHCMVGGAVNEYVICNCCTDGCSVYILNRTFGQGIFPLIKGEFRVAVDPSLCTSCGECARVCPFDARDPRDGFYGVGDCYGCGLCEIVCPSGASKMLRVDWYTSDRPEEP